MCDSDLLLIDVDARWPMQDDDDDDDEVQEGEEEEEEEEEHHHHHNHHQRISSSNSGEVLQQVRDAQHRRGVGWIPHQDPGYKGG